MRSILVATRNKHKVEEILAILGSGFQFMTLDDFPGAPAPVEDAPDFTGNASKKALTLAKWLASGHRTLRPDFVLADDSGLEVDALNGAPRRSLRPLRRSGCRLPREQPRRGKQC